MPLASMVFTFRIVSLPNPAILDNSWLVLISALADFNLTAPPASDCLFLAFLAIIGSNFNARIALW